MIDLYLSHVTHCSKCDTVYPDESSALLCEIRDMMKKEHMMGVLEKP